MAGGELYPQDHAGRERKDHRKIGFPCLKVKEIIHILRHSQRIFYHVNIDFI